MMMISLGIRHASHATRHGNLIMSIPNPLKFRRRRKPSNTFHSLIRLHTRRLSLSNASGTRSQIQRISRNQFLTLGRFPFRTFARRNMCNIHRIDFLQTAPLVFFEKKVDERDGKGATRGENVTVLKINGAGDEGGKERN